MTADFKLTAGIAFGEFEHLMEAKSSPFFLVGILDLRDEVIGERRVPLLPKQEAIGRQAVTAGATSFLIILLDAFRQSEVDDFADVWLVDAEAKSESADSDGNFVGRPQELVATPLGSQHFSVVGDRSDAVCAEKVYDVFHSANRGGVNNGAAVAECAEGAEKDGELFGAIGFANGVAKVFAIEAGDEFVRFAKRELFEDIVAHALRGAGGEGGDREGRELAAQAAEQPVLRAKIVAPIGDAVSFINYKEGKAEGFEPGQGRVLRERLGREVEQAIVAGLGRTADGVALRRAEGAVPNRCGYAEFLQLSDLILHERDERRNYDRGGPGLGNGGELITKRLAAAGGHNDAGVPASGDGGGNFQLAGPKGGVAPVAGEKRAKVVGGRHGALSIRFYFAIRQEESLRRG